MIILICLFTNSFGFHLSIFHLSIIQHNYHQVWQQSWTKSQHVHEIHSKNQSLPSKRSSSARHLQSLSLRLQILDLYCPRALLRRLYLIICWALGISQLIMASLLRADDNPLWQDDPFLLKPRRGQEAVTEQWYKSESKPNKRSLKINFENVRLVCRWNMNALRFYHLWGFIRAKLYWFDIPGEDLKIYQAKFTEVAGPLFTYYEEWLLRNSRNRLTY